MDEQSQIERERLQAEVERLKAALAGYGKRSESCTEDDMPCVSHMAYLEAKRQLAEQRAEYENILVDRNKLIAELSGSRAKQLSQRAGIERLQAEVKAWDAKWHDERREKLHYQEIAELYGKQRDDLAQQLSELRAENESANHRERLALMLFEKEHQLYEDQRTVIDGLVEALRKCQPFLCSMQCPSVKKTGELWKHHPDCIEANAALEAVEKVRNGS